MKVPVIVHNGLVDMIFLYQNLYCNLPTASTSFIADLVDLFPSGIVDTKYVTDFEHLMQASYLEYVYRKWYYKFVYLKSFEVRCEKTRIRDFQTGSAQTRLYIHRRLLEA